MQTTQCVPDMAPRFSICICTYRRPSVVDTVNSLLAQRGIALSEFEIIVADDDPGRSASERIRCIAQSTPASLHYIESAARNISACRNRCLESAKANWIAFIDDDQIAEPGWLREMISTAAKFRADVVQCYVRGIYPAETPDWMKAGGPYTYDYGPTGTELQSAATSGVLFRRDLPGSKELLFDTALGVTGGEDADYFLRYHALSGKIVSCREAVANEVVPVERVTPTYLQRKCRRHGHIYGRIVFAKKSAFGSLLSTMKSVVGMAVTSPYAAIRTVWPEMSCWMFMKFWYHFGVLEWACGRDSLDHE
jgi:succinoglycan biosynthesis protein ExoM